MSFLPLTLGVGHASSAGGSGGSKKLTKTEIEKTLKRDDYSCRFCGFRSLKYQQVFQADKDFVTACSFCEQVRVLDYASFLGGGVLIWLPEISQAELNHTARAIYVAQSDDKSALAPVATRALDALMGRRTEAKKRLNTDDPLLLATIMHENLSDKECDKAAEKLEGVRLMPFNKYMVRTKNGDYNGFSQIIQFWKSAEGPFAKLPTDAWEKKFTDLAPAA